MYETRKINIMRTDTLESGVDWCNEAYENADVIIFQNYFFKKVRKGSDNSIHFTCVIATSIDVTFFDLSLNKNSGTIKSFRKSIKYQ